MTADFWIIYGVTVFIASIVPGPSMLLALSHGIRYGTRRTLATAMGNVTATVIQAMVSIAGLGVILTASEMVFLTIKWCGAAYLVYTGLMLFRTPVSDFCAITGKEHCAAAGAGRRKLFLQAFWVAAGNPKAIVFFTALFPQFISTHGAPLLQYAVMIAVMAVIAFVCFMIYATGGDRLMFFLRDTRGVKWIQRLIAGTFIGVGVGIASVRQ